MINVNTKEEVANIEAELKKLGGQYSSNDKELSLEELSTSVAEVKACSLIMSHIKTKITGGRLKKITQCTVNQILLNEAKRVIKVTPGAEALINTLTNLESYYFEKANNLIEDK